MKRTCGTGIYPPCISGPPAVPWWLAGRRFWRRFCPTPEAQRRLCERIGGTVVEATGQKSRATQKTQGGVLHWIGTEPKNGKKAREDHKKLVEERERELGKLIDEIRAAYGGRAPRVFDPFSGGGAIPLEAMRLGCEACAADLNPVAVFVLNATLKYPQSLAGKTAPLPAFIRSDAAFMKEYGKKRPGADKTMEQQASLISGADPLAAEPDWHVRAWGQWVLNDARKTLAKRYPTYAVWEPVQDDAPYEPQESRLVPLDANGLPDVAALNKDYDAGYLKDERNARWIARPTVAYLWARTAACKNCRNTIPLLKTKWLCKTKSGKRVALKVDAKDGTPFFSIWNDVPVMGFVRE